MNLLDKIAQWYEQQSLVRGLIVSLPGVGGGLHEMLASRAAMSRRPNLLKRIGTVLQLLHALDSSLLELIRDHRHASPARIAQQYEDVIRLFFVDAGLEKETFHSLLEDRRALTRFAEQECTAGLDVHIGDRCRWVEYHAPEGVLRIDPAHLMWDCTCRPVKGGYHRDARCPLHKQELADVIAARFGNQLVRIRYDGSSMYWKQGAEFWPPSIDAVHMIEDLQTQGVFSQATPRVLDVGCGTGFLGIVATRRNNSIVSVTFSDWLPTPLFWTAMNWSANSTARRRVDVKFKLSLNTSWERPKQSEWAECPFDLVLCNPPYLPIPQEFHHLALSNTVAGTELLEHVIRTGRSLGARAYVAFSELAAPEAKRAAAEGGVALTQVSDYHRVPFRVRHALVDEEYMKYLAGRGLEASTTGGHRYWHRVATFLVEGEDVT